MLTAILVLQIIIIILIVLFAIIGGRKLTQKRLTASYQPIIYYESKLFRDKVVASHRVQLFYDEVPIGESKEEIIYQANIVDREAVSAAFTFALENLQKTLMIEFKADDIQDLIKKILP